MKTLGELRAAIDALIAAHGSDVEADFLFQYGSGRTTFAPVTGYTVFASHLTPHVRFKVGYARGEVMPPAARPTTPGTGDGE